jgi:hypothetical protein
MGNGSIKQWEMSHLINHCDCTGYYLPDEFTDPQWIETTGDNPLSIGSSVKLLNELTELLTVRDTWPPDLQLRWDAVFIPVVASVVYHEVIKFC